MRDAQTRLLNRGALWSLFTFRKQQQQTTISYCQVWQTVLKLSPYKHFQSAYMCHISTFKVLIWLICSNLRRRVKNNEKQAEQFVIHCFFTKFFSLILDFIGTCSCLFQLYCVVYCVVPHEDKPHTTEKEKGSNQELKRNGIYR